MADSTTDAMLSTRGTTASRPGGLAALMKVWNDMYDASSNPSGYISLGVAKNALMHTEMAQYINSTFSIPDFSLTYGEGGSGSKRLRAAVSRFVNRHFKPVVPVESEQINVSNGVTTSIEGCAWHLGNAGDGFLLGQPYYGSFPHDLGDRAGVKLVGVKLGEVDPMSVDAVAKYEEALLESREAGPPVKAVILASPHNPLGRCYSRDALVAFMRLCQKYKIHLISDEIYALSIWENPEYPDATPFTSVLAIDTKNIIAPELVHVLWGMSKDFGANGLRLGCCISQNNPAFMSALRIHGLFTFPSAVSDHIACNILENDEFTDKYIATNQKRLGENYALTLKFLHEHEIPYYPGSNAAFFVWVDLGEAQRRKRSNGRIVPNKQQERGIEDSEIKENKNMTSEIFEKLLDQRIFLASGEAFGSERAGWFRIVFSQPREYLEEGLARMVKAIE